ncbi:hypothetical protein AB0K16_25815 [Nonomuraea jabiensis]|uniref:hypothetical protein n=1 Tax=Nonomuraea jabiensis TaxID=882448 RepID=UPI0034481EC9
MAAAPDGALLGLRSYGGGCTDTVLHMRPSPLDRDTFKRRVARLRPKGDTPIAYALKQAAKDFSSDGTKTILLVSDGEETCGGDPVATARAFAEKGVDVQVDVIGFRVKDAARTELVRYRQGRRRPVRRRPERRRTSRPHAPARPARSAGPDAGRCPGPRHRGRGGGAGFEARRVPGRDAARRRRQATLRLRPARRRDRVRGVADRRHRAAGRAGRDRVGPVPGASGWRARGDQIRTSTAPLELTLIIEPPAVDVAALPPAATANESAEPLVASEPARVVGSGSCGDGPVLTDGRYTDAMIPAKRRTSGCRSPMGSG